MRESSGALRLSGGKTQGFVALIEPITDTESLAPDSPFAGDSDKRQPLRKDLLDRTFALEARTIRNQNALLNDDLTHLKTFDILRDTIDGKYRKP